MGGKKPLGRSQHAPVAVKMSVWGLRLSQAVSEHIRAIQKQQQQQTNTQNITKAHSLHYWAIPQAIDLTLKRETIFGFHLFSVGSSFGRKRPPLPPPSFSLQHRLRMHVSVAGDMNGVEMATAGPAAGLFSGMFSSEETNKGIASCWLLWHCHPHPDCTVRLGSQDKWCAIDNAAKVVSK